MSGPTNESAFYQRVRERTVGWIGWERIEPSNESGFPDTYFVLSAARGHHGEGTVEFKYKACKGEPQLNSRLTKGTQKAALLEYHAMGGCRRWFVSLNAGGMVRLYNTQQAADALRGVEEQFSMIISLEDPDFSAALATQLRWPS